MTTVTVHYGTEEVPGKGWIARAEDIHATAQGETEADAVENLKKLVEEHRDLLQPLIEEAELELVHA